MIIFFFALFIATSAVVCADQSVPRKVKLIYLLIEFIVFLILASCVR